MDNALATLFYPIEQDLIDFDVHDCAIGFLNARDHLILHGLDKSSLFLQQYFKPYAGELQDQGFHVSSGLDHPEESCDVVFIVLPKNADEAQYLIAHGLKILKRGGLIFCAADNKAGGGRLKKYLQQFTISDLQDASKNKARVVWGLKDDIDVSALEQAEKAGHAQPVLDGQFMSQAGIFGWDKIDKGSELLTQHLPPELKGAGADFGCGYGYLSKFVLEHGKGVTNFSCIDADYRAIQLAQENLRDTKSEAQLRYFWEDLTRPLLGLRDLDFIVMNPPFHEGKISDSDIGKAFINTAYQSLAPGGALWMVANAQLPYEDILEGLFRASSKKFEGDGFKIFCAEK